MEVRWCLSTSGSTEYILPISPSTCITSVSLNTSHHWLQMYLMAAIELEGAWRDTWSMRLSKLRDALGGRNWVSLEMHLETRIEWVQRCTCRPWSSKFGDALGGLDQVTSEMHLEVVIECVGRLIWRPWSIKIGGVLQGSRSGCRHNGCWDSIPSLTCNCGKFES